MSPSTMCAAVRAPIMIDFFFFFTHHKPLCAESCDQTALGFEWRGFTVIDDLSSISNDYLCGYR